MAAQIRGFADSPYLKVVPRNKSALEKEIADRLRQAERIRLGVGVTGRTVTLGVVGMLALGGATVGMQSDWHRLAAILAILLIALIGMIGTWRFASKHPEAALLEGAEFLRLKEAEIAAKGVISIPSSEPGPNPTPLPPRETE